MVDPMTWIMSDVLRDQGFEAIRYESVRDEGKYNLAVFPKNISKGSLLKAKDKKDGQSHFELNSDNLDDFLCSYL